MCAWLLAPLGSSSTSVHYIVLAALDVLTLAFPIVPGRLSRQLKEFALYSVKMCNSTKPVGNRRDPNKERKALVLMVLLYSPPHPTARASDTKSREHFSTLNRKRPVARFEIPCITSPCIKAVNLQCIHLLFNLIH